MLSTKRKKKFRNVGVITKEGLDPKYVKVIGDVWPEVKITHLKGNKKSTKRFDLIMALGGDGTLLHAVDYYPKTPVVGINFGTVGFLTAADKGNLETAIELLRKGKYIVEERPIIEMKYGRKTLYAFNEIVVKSLSKLIELDLSIDGENINRLRGDGLIVGTSSGSTAYLLATGNPVVSPALDCFIIAGLNEFSLTRHNIILDCRRVIEVTLASAGRDNQVFLVHDGKSDICMKEGEKVTLKRAPFSAPLIFFHKNHFFHNLGSKLNYGKCNPS